METIWSVNEPRGSKQGEQGESQLVPLERLLHHRWGMPMLSMNRLVHFGDWVITHNVRMGDPLITFRSSFIFRCSGLFSLVSQESTGQWSGF